MASRKLFLILPVGCVFLGIYPFHLGYPVCWYTGHALFSKSWPLFLTFLSCWLSSFLLSTMPGWWFPPSRQPLLCSHTPRNSPLPELLCLLCHCFLPSLTRLLLSLPVPLQSSGKDYCLPSGDNGNGMCCGLKGENSLHLCYGNFTSILKKKEEEEGRGGAHPLKLDRLFDLEQVLTVSGPQLELGLVWI